MELNGNSTTEYKAVATFLDNDTFKVTKVENGVETTWYGWETVKYDTSDPKIDARCTAQMIAENDGYKPNIKANSYRSMMSIFIGTTQPSPKKQTSKLQRNSLKHCFLNETINYLTYI